MVDLSLGAILTFVVLAMLIWAIDDWIAAGWRRWHKR